MAVQDLQGEQNLGGRHTGWEVGCSHSITVFFLVLFCQSTEAHLAVSLTILYLVLDNTVVQARERGNYYSGSCSGLLRP